MARENLAANGKAGVAHSELCRARVIQALAARGDERLRRFREAKAAEEQAAAPAAASAVPAAAGGGAGGQAAPAAAPPPPRSIVPRDGEGRRRAKAPRSEQPAVGPSSAVAWGSAAKGGDGSGVDLTNVAAADCGTYACVALKNDGTAVAWGYAANGGDASGVDLTNVAAAMCGENACVAVKNDGTAVA